MLPTINTELELNQQFFITQSCNALQQQGMRNDHIALFKSLLEQKLVLDNNFKNLTKYAINLELGQQLNEKPISK